MTIMAQAQRDAAYIESQRAQSRLVESVKEHSPQKAASRNPDGRPAAEFKIVLVTTNGAKKVQRVADSYEAAVGHALWLLSLDETGEVEIQDRENDVTWRMV